MYHRFFDGKVTIFNRRYAIDMTLAIVNPTKNMYFAEGLFGYES